MIEFAAKGELYKQLQKQGSFSDRRSSRVRATIPICSPLLRLANDSLLVH